MLMLPVLLPTWVGVKVTVMVQLPPAPSEVPQLLVCAKSPADTMLAIFSVAVPLFVRVTGNGALVVLDRRPRRGM